VDKVEMHLRGVRHPRYIYSDNTLIEKHLDWGSVTPRLTGGPGILAP
jgi:hypothetical protein